MSRHRLVLGVGVVAIMDFRRHRYSCSDSFRLVRRMAQEVTVLAFRCYEDNKNKQPPREHYTEESSGCPTEKSVTIPSDLVLAIAEMCIKDHRSNFNLNVYSNSVDISIYPEN